MLLRSYQQLDILLTHGVQLREAIMRGQFTLEYWPDGDWLVEVPGMFSQGASIEELRENIQDTYDLMVTQARPLAPATAQRQPLGLPAGQPAGRGQ
jgi:predicted RNase H-like HicB family nuclease